MKEGPDISRLAALIGDPARANILTALMAGKALTATELAAEAGVTAQTASTHLARLAEGGLVTPTKQGRHKYFTLADPSVATALEQLAGLAARVGHLRHQPGPRDAGLRAARVCYYHLAGEAGIRLHSSMVHRGFLKVAPDGLTLTPPGRNFLTGIGLNLTPLNNARPPLCRTCLDWSERRDHLGGRLGRALLDQMQTQGWLRRTPGSRAIAFTPKGTRAFAEAFPLAAVA
ncbi:MAG: transcriptional regulator [Cereibacter sphaeroides]|uniref:Transcriptional regulator n=1 Tax=Cereibacter sphaeroides TaxID=1063 RepID=A0A2W5SCX7_CERSP|nr:MAG: transcriptional regulator [Cereibacter sphaeroides]